MEKHTVLKPKKWYKIKAILLKNGFLFYEKCSQKGDHGVSLKPPQKNSSQPSFFTVFDNQPITDQLAFQNQKSFAIREQYTPTYVLDVDWGLREKN